MIVEFLEIGAGKEPIFSNAYAHISSLSERELTILLCEYPIVREHSPERIRELLLKSLEYVEKAFLRNTTDDIVIYRTFSSGDTVMVASSEDGDDTDTPDAATAFRLLKLSGAAKAAGFVHSDTECVF